jgi:hypothetical protein
LRRYNPSVSNDWKNGPKFFQRLEKIRDFLPTIGKPACFGFQRLENNKNGDADVRAAVW